MASRPYTSTSSFTSSDEPLLKQELIASCQRRVAETLQVEALDEIGKQLQAPVPPKPAYPVIAPQELVNFDGYLLGVPVRFGSMPAQWKVRGEPAMESEWYPDEQCGPGRHSGTQRARCGRRVRSRVNMQESSCRLPVREADKVRWNSMIVMFVETVLIIIVRIAGHDDDIHPYSPRNQLRASWL